MTFAVTFNGMTMRCRLTRNDPYRHLILLGYVNGECRMSSDVRAFAHLKAETFRKRLEESALCRLRAIANGTREQAKGNS